MLTAKIYIQRLIQDSQDYGSNDEHMVSRVFFDFEISGKKHQGLFADIKQAVGTSFETAPLEVSKPIGYKGAFNYEAFQKIVEQYYRSLIGKQGSGIRIEGATNVRMRNNTYNVPLVAEFEVNVSGGTW